ncbi:hypothetical protein ABID22_003411 [Pontibacter aydingkolensis]|uniref:DUF4249 domain-containing protein n=1 Tax=Pontibacter aydingkolensis TaxID=1911536 RepID=A0ABS7CZ62_9BACT|nr:DUF4249 domain-containing protein [Pontibacter aydingkolensis]MBW7468807.1 DUF4249 domain-containing protein [Pontibacter aydingkolensis]
MKIKNWRVTLGWFLMLLVSSCVEPYSPKVMEAPNSFLVVNGFINSNGPTTIQLLRTQNLSDESTPPAETGAVVKIEAENGENYRLQDIGGGNYTIGSLTLNPAVKYRLFIKTRDNKEYVSDFIEVKQTPAIDEVTWKAVDNEVQFFVSTHDPKNDTRYYRWEFEDTWHFRPAFPTIFKYENGAIRIRDDRDEEISNCWRTERSTTIELSNSARLSKDVISNYKLLALPYNSERVAIKYSLLVKQYALSRQAYEYWEILKKNTESIGTLFDPLPSQLTSNIRCTTNPEEPVIGFLSASTMQEKRIFLESKDLPREWRLFNPTCIADTMLLSQGNIVDYFKGGYNMPVSEVYPPSGGMFPIGYVYASRACVDCTVRGTNVKPDYWE